MSKYIPNILTSFRTVVAILIPFLFFSRQYFLLSILFILALLSDLFDGFLARKLNAVSISGKILDMVGDKMLALSALSTFLIVIEQRLSYLLIGELTIAIIMSYFFVSSGAYKELDLNRHESSIFGKIKTWFLFVTLGASFLSYKYIILSKFILPLIFLTFILQIITIIDYIIRYRKK